MLPGVCAHHSTAPEHWSYAIPLQVEHIVMAHIASKGNLQREERENMTHSKT